jgi:hypothetical protein
LIALVTGSRNWTDRAAVERAFDQYRPTLIVHGDARGLDTLADQVAEKRGIDRVKCPANWVRHGKRAGMIRNRAMIDLMRPHVVIAFPLPASVGTVGMIGLARQRGIAVAICGEDF